MRICDNMLIVCTYEELGNMYRHVMKENNQIIDLEVMDNRYGKDMEKVLAHIDSFRNKGKEIIITRGFLAEQIRSHLPYKVIEIHISGIDVLQAIYPYAKRGLVLGVVESQAFLKVITPIAELLGLKVREYEVVELGDFDRGIAAAIADGVDLIAGGAWANYNVEGFSDFPVPYIPIESSEESIKRSLENAMSIYEMMLSERKRKELLETLVECSDAGLLALDENGKLLAANSYARKLLALALEKEFLPEETPLAELLNEKTPLSRLVTLDGTNVLTRTIPMCVEDEAAGAVVMLKRTEDVQAEEKMIRQGLVQKGLYAKYDLDSIQGHSSIITSLKKLVKMYAATDANVLILGESGTGKELFAQSVHNRSLRKDNPFVAVNCSALPASLLESELFGYVDGAFTGAKKGGKAGLFELAHKGTIFLDEIGEMDLGMQARLLRVLQEKEIMRIGDNKVISIDVRIVAATNKNLYQEMEAGHFREDLYYRLNILDLKIPPLRERKEDIAEIANAGLLQINKRLNCKTRGFDSKVLEKLKEYTWRGNIRELMNVLEKMVIVVQYGIIKYSDVAFIFQDMDSRQPQSRAEPPELPEMKLREMEKLMMKQALEKTGGNKTKAAMLLGIDRTTLLRKLAQYS